MDRATSREPPLLGVSLFLFRSARRSSLTVPYRLSFFYHHFSFAKTFNSVGLKVPHPWSTRHHARFIRPLRPAEARQCPTELDCRAVGTRFGWDAGDKMPGTCEVCVSEPSKYRCPTCGLMRYVCASIHFSEKERTYPC